MVKVRNDNHHYHTDDNGKHLSPCIKRKCNGSNPTPNAPTVNSTKHQIHHLHDPLAKPSHKVGYSKSRGNTVVGDGDIWVEVLCESVKTGQIMSFFKSTKHPERKVAREPPTGASRVVYLSDSYVEKYKYAEWFQRQYSTEGTWSRGYCLLYLLSVHSLWIVEKKMWSVKSEVARSKCVWCLLYNTDKLSCSVCCVIQFVSCANWVLIK